MKKYLSMAGYIIIYFGTIFVSVFALTLIWINFLKPVRFLYINSNFINVLGFSITIGVISLIYKKRKMNLIKTCRFKRISMGNFVLVSLSGVLMGALSCLICNTSLIKGYVKSFEKYLWDLEHGSSSVLLFAVCMLLTIVLEEMVFRGVVFNEISSRFSLYKAILISSAVYGLVNVLNPGLLIILYAFVSAFLYTLAYVYTGSIISNVILQSVSMAIIYIVRKAGLWLRVGELGDAVIWAGVAAAGFLMGICYCFMYKTFKKRQADGTISEAA